ncbi:hypothetical protein SERLADRAFT_408041 [Serpula lacrymans var. lacrymans S7.9]|uniref:Uncharacterized protein n=1 Tax=Serpula lacrymans var. lacrymans (strain S7.9) TaxID=578457 RepID=F8NU18_SERL9|nr:uncharacterized protein SERLADRAFT_408041 [Serpula lacrymans var. lacrymans S7.9]EGO25784.1 hypothetical protein SERLADRAFT_408041 [Serpula lacrymans var. lacrymans S7.9]
MPSCQEEPLTILPTMASHNLAPPWHLFHTRVNFEQTEIILMLQPPDNHAVTLKSAREMHAILCDVSTALTYVMETIKILFLNQETRSYSVRFKDPLSVILDILEDEKMHNRIMLYPESTGEFIYGLETFSRLIKTIEVQGDDQFQAGKKYAVCVNLWVNSAVLHLIHSSKASDSLLLPEREGKEKEEEEGEEDYTHLRNDPLAKAQVEEI